MQQHFVTFYSPGTFVSEKNTKPIASWDVDLAVSMAREIVQRYNARPYGFRFSTRTREDHELDSKETETSPFYYLGGKIETAEEVLARNDPKEEILRSNLRVNNIKRLIVNNNSWRFTAELKDDDVVLDVTL